MLKPRIGLLPLHLELYDSVLPNLRAHLNAFYSTIAEELRARDVDVVTSPVCRVEPEFNAAIKSFEQAQADCIVTLHLAYSPSLESVKALASTKLPVIVLDTTPTYDFGPGQDPAEVFYNHGIHGVQDMCNVLARNGKDFHIEAGHWKKSNVLDRVTAWARVTRIATSMRTARIGLIGGQFKGMGDFRVPFDTLRSTIGIEVVQASPKEIAALLPAPDDPAVVQELADDLARFAPANVLPHAHTETARVGIAVRRWMEGNTLSGFTMNFMDIDRASGLPTMPFLEASKSMSRGLGYAGEGDVLTAALVGALAGTFPETSFAEMFCPDWKNGSIFVSHMGEMNVDLAADKAVLMEKSLPWIDVANPVIAVGRFRPGDAVLVDLAPAPDNSFTLIVAPGRMLDVQGTDRMTDSIRGWFEPPMPVSDFLSAYSYAGGTHHLALVYVDTANQISRFGEVMGWSIVLIGEQEQLSH